MTDIQLKKCGIRFNPPAIIVTYLIVSKNKLHRRTMPVRNFTKNSGIQRTVDELRLNKKHEKYLQNIPLRQLEKLLTVIQDKMKGISLEDSLREREKLETIDPEEDLNKADDRTLAAKKAVMEESFEKNRKKPGDPGYEYDVEVEFEGGVETCEWDDDSDPDF
ncbi:centrosomal protein of 19 kDa [Lingula anatina]|uniref:Centrosomal protein of 19 kDa n=1 Tax=Lingula anatina TaxID=7574 RepID=A0A2R2MSZ0_LINAN|nr:centrosomal protein of 19 kDa [Lingula anatina]|eukprot:XP_023933243.1 centrosomal protein of 19 kDa [Lingula anatina]